MNNSTPEWTPPLIAVVGPTASGKSALAHALAKSCREWSGRDAQIVSVDAFALYRGMDIGTAKPSAAEQAEVPYHQVDELDISEVASVASYQRHARAAVERIQGAGQVAIAVGGSALYVRALLDEMNFPGSDPQVRAALEAEADHVGGAALYERLRQLDPPAAAALHPHNVRRIVRALEVIEITGRPFTASLPKPVFVRPTLMLGVRRQLEDLDQRIEQRTRAMFEAGLVEEVRALVEQGLERSVTASRAVGYGEVLGYLRGEYGLDEARQKVALATRQLSRRQIKWFRRDRRIHWLDATGRSSAEILADARGVIYELR